MNSELKRQRIKSIVEQSTTPRSKRRPVIIACLVALFLACQYAAMTAL